MDIHLIEEYKVYLGEKTLEASTMQISQQDMLIDWEHAALLF